MATENMDEMKKLSLNEMEDVSGGTFNECNEIRGAIVEAHNQGRLKDIGSGKFWVSDVAEDLLNQLGIECHASEGFFGIGSVNNTYRDKETGQFLLHREVVEYIKTGKRKWR